MRKYFLSFFGSNENFKICFQDLLTFRHESLEGSIKEGTFFIFAKWQFMLFYRSGSSLVGSILSAKSTSTYFFEPYHWKHFNHKNGSKLDLHFNKVEEKFISDFTKGLFDCNKVSNFTFLRFLLHNQELNLDFSLWFSF